MENKKDDQVVSNNCHVTNGNGCTELPNNSDDKMELAAEIREENGVDETFSLDESRPSKKPRSVIEEEILSGEVDDGGIALFFFFKLFYFVLIVGGIQFNVIILQ